MGDVVRQGFATLDKWPLVQAAVAVLVLVIAALLAWATLRRQLPQPPPVPGAAPPPATPIQIESPWLVQHLVEMHLDIEKIRSAIEAMEAHLRVSNAKIDGLASLLKRRQARREQAPKS